VKSVAKTVLYFNPTGFIGGAEKNLLLMCGRLPRNRYTPIVVLPEEGPLPRLLRDLDVETIYFPKRLVQTGQIFNVLWGCYTLRAVLKNRPPIHFIHSNSIFCLYLPVYYGWFTRKPVFVHWADFDARKGDIRLLNLFKSNTTVLAVSESIRKTLLQGGVHASIIEQLYNGIEEEPLVISDRTAFLKRYRVSDTDYIVGITGRIDSWKGHRYAIKALKRLSDLPVKLFILGEYHQVKNPWLQYDLERLIHEENLSDRVIFTGFVENPRSFVYHFNAVLVPSDYEPFGLVAVEAMALKKPVIASRTGGLEEIVQDGVTGFLVPPKEEEALAERIRYLYMKRDIGRKMGEQGYDVFHKRFTGDIFIQKLIRHYESKT